MDKAHFEISHKEWLFAQTQSSSFHIYRVFGAGKPKPVLARIVNPYAQWRGHKVGVYMSM